LFRSFGKSLTINLQALSKAEKDTIHELFQCNHLNI